jgi:uncharacterized protein (TIGR03032 family)
MTVEREFPRARAAPQNQTAVDFEHSGNLAEFLNQLGISLLVSTYQAGKVLSVGCHSEKVQIRFHDFEQAMGLARTPTGLAIGTRRQVWFLPAAPDLAAQVKPAGEYDGCFLARQAHFTGPVMAHDLAWCGGELWVVNTLFSSLCVLRPEYSFVPRWQPPFVSALAGEDRCHLNGLAADEKGPRFVTALAETDTPAGWRAHKANGGCLIDFSSGDIVARGLSMPHSPRLHQDQLWMLDSGRGQLNRCDLAKGQLDTVAQLPGYTRGLDCFGRFAFVGLSRIRESSVFGGLPISEHKGELRCGVAVVDLVTGQTVCSLHFKTGVEEVFDVKVLPGFRNPLLSGPFPDIDQAETLWLVPSVASEKSSLAAGPAAKAGLKDSSQIIA